MRKNFTPEQMLHTVRQAESGTPVAEVCRKMGITEQTFYKWKRRLAGMGIAELTRLRQLEDEDRKLKSLVADLTLDKHMLQEVLRRSSKAGAQASAGGVFVWQFPGLVKTRVWRAAATAQRVLLSRPG